MANRFPTPGRSMTSPDTLRLPFGLHSIVRSIQCSMLCKTAVPKRLSLMNFNPSASLCSSSVRRSALTSAVKPPARTLIVERIQFPSQ